MSSQSSAISYFFSPKSIAVIGASRSPTKMGRIVFDSLLDYQGGPVYPINPNAEEISGHLAYSSVKELKGKIDLAIIAIPAEEVPAAVRDCSLARVKACAILTAGFSEIGNKKLETDISKLRGKMRILGPNIIGIYNPKNNLDAIFNPRHRQARPQAGKIAFISQSGAFGAALLDWCKSEGIGISKFASIGNAIDVDEVDLLNYLASDPETSAITLYLEGTKRGPELLKTLKNTTKRKPVICLKAGKTSAGAKAVMSHTAALAGDARIWSGALRQSGAIEVNQPEQLFDLAKVFTMQPLPRGNRVAVITNGGGFGVISTDNIIREGLEMAQLTKHTISKIKSSKILPSYATLSNPLDITGSSTTEMYRIAIQHILAERGVDSLLVIILFQVPELEPAVVNAVSAGLKFRKPIVVCTTGGEYASLNSKQLEKLGITTYQTPSRAVTAIAALTRYAEIRKGR